MSFPQRNIAILQYLFSSSSPKSECFSFLIFFFFFAKAIINSFSSPISFPVIGNKPRKASVEDFGLPVVLMKCLLLMFCHSSQALELLKMWSK